MNYFVWDVNPTIFSVGSFQLRWYSLLFALSFYLGLKYMGKVFQKNNLSEKTLDSLFWHVVIGVILGARLGHCLLYEPSYFLARPLEILMVWKGGLASHGGALGLLIALILFCKKQKKSLVWILDNLTIPMALSAAFIRLGNFFNSEILGNASDLPWAIIFVRVDPTPRHPAQLYESLSYFLILSILFFVQKSSKVNLEMGKVFGIFVSFVFSARLLIEFVKIPQEAYENSFFLNTSPHR